MKKALKYALIGCFAYATVMMLLTKTPYPVGLWLMGLWSIIVFFIALYLLDMMLPWFKVFSPNLDRLPKNMLDAVAITFDDGPHPDTTPKLLDVLDQFQMRACFFCIGQHVDAYPSIVREIVRRGHLVGNHSYHHRVLPFMSMAQAKNEIISTQTAFKQCGVGTSLFRFPKGYRSYFLHRLCVSMKLIPVGFSYPAYDVENPPPEKIVSLIEKKLSAGDILLFHDGLAPGKTGSRSSLIEALPKILELIRLKNLRVASLDELTQEATAR